MTSDNKKEISSIKNRFGKNILEVNKSYGRVTVGNLRLKLEDELEEDHSLENPVFFGAARALARFYGQEDGTTSKAEPDQPSALPIATPDVSIDLEGLEMNRGGSPLIELKYNY